MVPPPSASTASAPFDLSRSRRVHVVAVGGAGMSAIAALLAQGGHTVTGSDVAEGPNLAPLRDLGVGVQIGHDAANVAGAEVVVASTAVADDNVELAEARRLGIPVQRRREFLGSFAVATPFLSVAGTHGKTTTSSLLAVALRGAGVEPSWLLGAPVPALGGAASLGSGSWMVLEADESDGSFLVGPRAGAVLTNAEADHLEFWGGWDNLRDAFEEFMASTSGPTVACADDPGSAAIAASVGAVLYGSGSAAGAERSAPAGLGYEMTDLRLDTRGSRFTLRSPRGDHEVALWMPGAHNALNATGALALAGELGVDLGAACAALGEHTGLYRRFEHRGAAGGVEVVDDYAHLPTEVRAALKAGSRSGWGRLVVVFQPHRYSRTEALWSEFGPAFGDAEVLVLTDIYAAGEEPREGVTGKLLVDAVMAAGGPEPIWAPTLPEAAAALEPLLVPGDVLMTVGAGDVRDVGDMVLEALGGRDRGCALMGTLADDLAFLGDRFSENVPVAPWCTYRVGGPARYSALVESESELLAVAEALAALAVPMEVLVLGRGSNLLVADRGFDGLVLRLGEGLSDVRVEGHVVVAGASAALPVVARRSVAESLSGFEWAVGVPGSIGGAVRMNAGGHGSDMAATLLGVRVVDLRTGENREVAADSLDLAYRSSNLAPHEVVTSARLGLGAGSRGQGEALVSEIVAWRREHQPGGHNAGSVFTNPPGDSAGRLIDAAGCKGLRLGSAEVSTKHANFIQADDGGSADDVRALMLEVISRVREMTGTELHPETVMVGFDPPPVGTP